MDDMAGGAAYYHPPPALHYPYYPPPPPPPPGATPPLPYSHSYPYPHHEPPPYAASPPFHHYDYHHHHHHHLPPPRDEVRTLFIAGLPDDVKRREIYNLFREFPGYESAQLRTSGQPLQAYAFAVFSDQQSALAAMNALNGIMFDLERDSTLYIELAKSNSRSKHSRTDDGVSYSSAKKFRGTVTHTTGYLEAGGRSNIHMPGLVSTAHSLNGYPSTQRNHEVVNEAEQSKLSSSSTTYVPQNNPPCPTLFVANLGQTCSDHELAQVFSRCPGFLKLKMQNKNGLPVAFVDFQDEDSSTGALNHLQGTMLHSSVGEGMRLEYAKSRMGLRKREKRK